MANNFVPANKAGENNLLRELLGFDTPKHYLILLLNNTELRPGGGFIGAYAVVKLDQGKPSLVAVEGTELLDGRADKTRLAPASDLLKKYLKVNYWYFRDSNWSPDFARSSFYSLEAYRREAGPEADKINAIIGFTPTAIAELLDITGPITVDGIIFNSQNFVEKLEYEVEYGFVQRGISFADRKKLMSSLAKNLLSKVEKSALFHWKDYYDWVRQIIARKELMVYSENVNWQTSARGYGVTGEQTHASGDYLQWVDANLGALKTDLALKRSLNYKIFADAQGRWRGQATMKYEHQGNFDWRTTRYRTYARVFVPVGSEFIKVSGAMEMDKVATTTADFGTENDKFWLGAFTVIEPGETKFLTFEYYLSTSTVALINSGDYRLNVQKQLGSLGHKLTLDFNFGKTIMSTAPAGDAKLLKAGRYKIDTDLTLDRVFSVKLK